MVVRSTDPIKTSWRTRWTTAANAQKIVEALKETEAESEANRVS